MASFKDSTQREWTLQITGPAIDLIREDLDPLFLLHETEENETRKRLAADPALFCHVIFLLCKKQREKLGVDLDEFYTEVIGSGEAIEAAGEALNKAFANFSQPQMRELYDAINEKEKTIQSLAIAKVKERLNDPALEQNVLRSLDEMLDAALAKGLTGPASATSSPATSA